MVSLISKRFLSSSVLLRAQIVDETLSSISRMLPPPAYPGPPSPPLPFSSSSNQSNQQQYKQPSSSPSKQSIYPTRIPNSNSVEPPSTSRTKIPIPIPIQAAEQEVLESQSLNSLLVKLLNQLNSIFPPKTVPTLQTLLSDYQSKRNEVLQEELKYEPNPKPNRRINIAGSSQMNEKEEEIDRVRESRETTIETKGNTSTVKKESIIQSSVINIDHDSNRLEQDGIVTVCHVWGNGNNSIVSTCTGFKVGEQSEEGEGDKIVTCAHTLTAMSQHFNLTFSDSSSPASPSATFILTSSGHVFPVLSLLSSLPSSDILLLRISPEPMRDPSYALRAASSSTTSASPSLPLTIEEELKESERLRRRLVPRLKSLPCNPYPAKIGSRIASLDFKHPMAQSGNRNLNASGSSTDGEGREWNLGRIIEYQDSEGYAASTGTYDELSSMSITSIPTPGSSGSPIIDLETGTVVGLIRGSKHYYGDKGYRGFGTPIEKLFEMFQ